MGAPDRASALAAMQGGLGALLASMAFQDRAGEGAEQAPYDRGRAEELAQLAERLLALPGAEAERRGGAERGALGEDHGEERASPAPAVAEAALERAELVLACLRLIALAGHPPGHPPGPAEPAEPAGSAGSAGSKGRELVLAAGSLELCLEDALAAAGPAAAPDELAALAEAVGREARALVLEIRSAGAARMPLGPSAPGRP